jgi:predicted Zn-dependent protease
MHELIAKMESNRRQYVESAREWREALKLSPGNPSLQEGLAVALYQAGDLQGARAMFEDLLKRQPESAELNYMLGDTLLNSQKPQEAVPYLNKAVTLVPGLLAAHGSLARAYLALGEAEKAVPYLKAALPTDEDGSLHYQLGRAYQARGELALAREMLKKYQEIHNAQEVENKMVEKEVEITPP